MSDRQEFIRPYPPIPAENTYHTLRCLARTLEAADNRITVELSSDVMPEQSDLVNAQAWMLTAFLIADLADIDVHKIYELANSVWKGTQNVIF